MSTSLYYEELSVGQLFTSRAYALSADEIKAFARQYDPQPFHTHEELAQQSFFKGLAASGWHTAAITMRLMVECIPIAGGLIGGGLEELRWFLPVRPDDVLRLEAKILALRVSRSKPAQGIMRVQQTTFNQHHEPVQQFISTVIVPRRPT